MTAFHGPADRTADPLVLGTVAALMTAGALAGVFGLPSVRLMSTLGRARFAVIFMAGAGVFASQLIVSAFRYSDAPAGSVVVFVTGSVTGLLALGAAAALLPEKPVAAPLAGGLLAAAAGAGVLANWERPSSFSPIVKFAWEQAAMLGAGAMVVAGLAGLAWMARTASTHAVTGAYASGSAAAGLVGALFASQTLLGIDWRFVMPWAASAAIVFVSAAWLAIHGGLRYVGLALLAAPALLSALTLLEQATGMLGPRPLLVSPVIAASALLAGGLLAAAVRPSPQGDAQARYTLARAARWVSLAATALAVVSLVVPAIQARVHATRASGEVFDATFPMRGFEALGPWLLLAAATLVLAASMMPRSRSSAIDTVVGLAACAGVLSPLGATPLHTWVTWIPPDVQQDYGTEYAYIAFTRLPEPVVWVTVGLIVLAAALLLARLLLPARRIDNPLECGTPEAGR